MPKTDAASTDTPPKAEARAKRDYRALGQIWLKRINAQRKREQEWRDAAKRAEDAYKGKRNSAFPIIFANVETVVPALISTPPVPDIRPRHYATSDQDPVAMVASQILERGISTATDDGKILREMERCAQDAYTAGRATVQVAMEKRNGYACIVWREVPWSSLIVGPCARWEDAPWISIEEAVSADAIEDMRDAESKRLLDASAQDTSEREDDGEDKGTRSIYAVWDKRAREVVTLTTSGEVIRIQEDPFNLPDFYPVARPVQPIELTTNNIPICPQALYEQQAIELATIQRRINGLVTALRAVGIVIGSEAADALNRLKDAEDGTLVPISVEGAAAGTGDVRSAIQWVPLSEIVAALQGLYQARQDTKALIYEISGISDVIRGESDPNETATAQGIKNQWGSLRIKRLQMTLEDHARELFSIAAHMMATSFEVADLAEISASDPANPDFLAAADWLSQGLKDTRIDVESGSTSRADLGEAKQEMEGFLTAAAGYFQTVFPLGQMVPEAAPSLILIFRQFSRYFKLGRQVEDAIDQFSASIAQGVAQQAQQPKPPSPEEIKAKAQADKAAADMAQTQANMQRDQQQAALDAQKAEQDAVLEREKRDFEREKMAFEREKMAFELQLEALRLQSAQAAALAPKPEPQSGGPTNGSR